MNLRISNILLIFCLFGLNLSCAAGIKTAEIKFERKKIKISNHTLNVEIADSLQKQEIGLMNRSSLQQGSGMLFIYKKEQKLTFWMKNTKIPLSIAFFTKDRILINIEQMSAEAKEGDTKSYKRFYSKQKAMYALEVPMGWFKKNNVRAGSRFKFN